MTGVLTDNQVLSILNQLDADLNTILTQRRVLTYIKDLTLTHMEHKKTLAGWETTKRNMESTLAGLDSTIGQKRAVLLKAFNEDKESFERQLSALLRKVEEARDHATRIDADLAEKQKFFDTRSAQMDAEIKSKADELTKLTQGFAEFKKAHGMS